MNKSRLAIVYAVLAAFFYAINTPVNKLLLSHVPATFLASFLYLGAGLGVGLMYLFKRHDEDKTVRLSKPDAPFVLLMILLDIAAPIFMMLGIRLSSASSASLLGNFEIVATTLIALLFFHEVVSRRLWLAIVLITVSSAILSLDGAQGLGFSAGSLFVLLATICWGLENNCTRKISGKSTYQIVIFKGIFSGLGAFAIALVSGERLPETRFILYAMTLGYVAYGLSIFTYVRAQNALGAAKTSAFYALAPFIGSFLAFVLVGEELSANYLLALAVMIAGTVFVVRDTLK